MYVRNRVLVMSNTKKSSNTEEQKEEREKDVQLQHLQLAKEKNIPLP